MPIRRILSSITGSIIGGDTTRFIDLEIDKSAKKEEDTSDISKLEIKITPSHTPTLHVEKSSKPEVPIIGIGGAGLRLLNQIVTRVESYGMNYPTMALDTEKAELDRFENITHKFHIPGSDHGTAHQFRKAATRVRAVESDLTAALEQYFTDLKMSHRHEIVFILMGSGGTGSGAGIEVARILKKMGKRPVPYLILPSKEEMSRIKFNAAAALYYFNYAPKDRCLNLTTICVDNDLFLSRNSKKYYSSVIAASNERIAATMGDIIATTALVSHAYSADINEFLEIFRDLKGIGVLQYLQFDNPAKNIFMDFEENLDRSVSLEVDIYSATRGYIYVSARPDQIEAEDYRNLLLRFDNSDIFSKLYETDLNVDDDFLAIRGIYTGLSYPPRIEELMRLAEDARVEVINKEIHRSSGGKANPKIDRLDGDEELDVKTGEELYEERSKEYAKMRREGEE